MRADTLIEVLEIMLNAVTGASLDWAEILAAEASTKSQLRKAAASLSLPEFSSDDILTRHDDSVFFTSAAICRFKRDLLLDEQAPRGFVQQWCFRDRNYSALQLGESPKWSSCFRQFGTIAEFGSLAEHAITFGEAVLSLAREHRADVKLKASSSDVDLLRIINATSIEVALDTENQDYFRHKYGQERLSGRNANMAISPEGSDDWIDVGNIIVIERDGVPFATEVAIGIETLTSALKGAQSAIVATSIADPTTIALTKGHLSVVDALNVVLHLHATGIRPFSSNQGRIFRRYLDLLTIMTKTHELNLDQLVLHCCRRICELRGIAFSESYWLLLLEYLHERGTLVDLDFPARNARMSFSWSNRWPTQEASK